MIKKKKKKGYNSKVDQCLVTWSLVGPVLNLIFFSLYIKHSPNQLT